MKTGSLSSIADVREVQLPRFVEENGNLVVLEGEATVPFRIARVFVVYAGGGAIRGQHAHKRCAQFLTCTRGRVDVLCDDGESKASFVLDRSDRALLVPPGIWSEQTYVGDDTILTVACDRSFEAADYLREYEGFLDFRRGVEWE